MTPDLTTIELRQYTLLGGRRDELISLFEHDFIDPQNAVGAVVLGVFRDLDDPDRFVWLRGFADMAARQAALEGFYNSDVWWARRAAANATLLDSDNVRLLRPASPGRAWIVPSAQADRAGVVRIAVHTLAGADPAAFAAFFETAMAPRIAASGGGSLIARLATEPGSNTYPRLPVIEQDPVYAWVTRFADLAAEQAFTARLATQSGWRDAAPEALLPALMRKPEVLRLAPTATSPLR